MIKFTNILMSIGMAWIVIDVLYYINASPASFFVGANSIGWVTYFVLRYVREDGYEDDEVNQ
jgi:hypothetical protein